MRCQSPSARSLAYKTETSKDEVIGILHLLIFGSFLTSTKCTCGILDRLPSKRTDFCRVLYTFAALEWRGIRGLVSDLSPQNPGSFGKWCNGRRHGSLLWAIRTLWLHWSSPMCTGCLIVSRAFDHYSIYWLGRHLGFMPISIRPFVRKWC